MLVRIQPLEQRDKMERNEVLCFTGIASQDGLESFFPWKDTEDFPGTLNAMLLRTRFTSERHSAVFKVFLYKHHAEKVESFMASRQWKHALVYLKYHAGIIEVQKGFSQESWDAIPHVTLAEAGSIRLLIPEPTERSSSDQMDLFEEE